MAADLIVVHGLLAAVLFFLMNWLGGHAVITASYHQITYFSRYDEAPAFNVVFRILSPVVYIVIVGALLYSIGLAQYVSAIYLVVVYHYVIRWGYLAVFGRIRLVRWRVQGPIAVVAIAASILIYRQIISNPARLLPDFDSLTNELWLVIIVFLYKLFDSNYAPEEGNSAQKKAYLNARYNELSRKFGRIVSEEVKDRKLQPLVFAVLIYESFNRPRIVRWLERVLPTRGRLRSYGPMQVQAKTPISDEESVRQGSRQLVREYETQFAAKRANYSRSESYGEEWLEKYGVNMIHQEAVRGAVAKFNIRSDYPDEVLSVHDFLVEAYYPDLSGELVGLG